MGGDPFAVLKLVPMGLGIHAVSGRMGGDPFAVLKRLTGVICSRRSIAAWGETLLRY